MNLRLHRKILVVDGMTAFTGGMNIRQSHEIKRGLPSSVRDMHFKIRGPIVSDIQQVFAEDWGFATQESLRGDSWYPPISEEGSVLARCVDDGPDRHMENARWILLGAIAGARQRIRVMTPYFVPDTRLITSLITAVMRGIRVQVVLPAQNNLPWVKWASTGTMLPLVEKGVEIYYSPPPFDHSKLMTVDDDWTFFGSVNWDERSLRLNFELCLEAFDTELAAKISRHIDAMIERSKLVTLEQLEGRSLPVKLRDGFFRLFTPYL